MSSLAVSLLLLVVVAIALALFYNLRQAPPPQWFESAQRSIRQRLSDGGRGQRASAAGSQASGSPGRPADRGEPRLDAARRTGADAHVPTSAYADGDDDATGVEFDAPADAAPAARIEVPVGAAAGWSSDADSSSGARQSPGVGRTASARPADDAVDVPGPAGAEAKRSTTVATASQGAAAAEPTANPAISPATEVVAPSQRLSEVCDCIVEIATPGGCSGDRLAPIVQRFRRAGSKPVVVEAGSDSEPGAWHAPAAGHQYDRLRAGILLANRHGPLNAMEFSEFVTAVQAIAEAFSGSVPIPAMGTVLARARDLDATCAQLDAQIGVNVDAPEAIDPAQLAAIAPSLAIIERGSHRYVRPGSQGEALFSVSFSDSPNRLTFLLDVPRSPPMLEPWTQMIECASDCAKRLGARLADDGGRDLNAPALAQIGRQLEQRYESLDAIGLPAGSTFALKVFN